MRLYFWRLDGPQFKVLRQGLTELSPQERIKVVRGVGALGLGEEFVGVVFDGRTELVEDWGHHGIGSDFTCVNVRRFLLLHILKVPFQSV